MAKFTVTVCNVSSVEVEAEDEKAAYRYADNAIAYGTDGVMGLILRGQTGWEVTDVVADDGASAGHDPELAPEDRPIESDEDGLDQHSLLS